MGPEPMSWPTAPCAPDATMNSSALAPCAMNTCCISALIRSDVSGSPSSRSTPSAPGSESRGMRRATSSAACCATPSQAMLEVYTRALEEIGVAEAVVPARFPLELADHLRANGVDVRVDRELFEDRRRSKNETEIAGLRRAQRSEERRVGKEC